MSSQPFNSPRQALNWLKKRQRIDSVDGLTVYRYERPVRLVSWDTESDAVPAPAKTPPEDRLDDQAEDMLREYGHVFKKPKIGRMSGISSSGIISTSIWGGSVTSVSVDTETSTPSPIRGFVAGPAIVDEFAEVDMEHPDAIHRPIGGPDSPLVTVRLTSGHDAIMHIDAERFDWSGPITPSPESAVRDLTDEINQFNESLARPETRTTGFGSQPAAPSADEIARANREDIVQFKRLLDTMAG